MEAHADSRDDLLKQGNVFGQYLMDRNPFIKLLAISGSLTDESIDRHEDSDYFIVTKEGRVWECFAACVLYGLIHARRIGKPRTFFCFNYLIDEKYLVEELRIDKQSAREFLNLLVIYGNDKYKKILEDMPAVADYYPAEYKKRLLSSGKDPVVKPSGGLFFIILKPAFKAAAKVFEYRRKRRHNTGKIYSTDHVIRSHLHV